jgi:predicted RecB family nuclease
VAPGDEESVVFERFLTEVGKYPDARLYCYGSYERTFLKRMRKDASRKGPVDRALGALVNVLSAVYAHAYFPCHSNGLKDVGGCLGCSWSDPQASGLQSIVWRKRWEASHADEWKDRLVTYNREDCSALRRVSGGCALGGCTLGGRGSCLRVSRIIPEPGFAANSVGIFLPSFVSKQSRSVPAFGSSA